MMCMLMVVLMLLVLGNVVVLRVVVEEGGWGAKPGDPLFFMLGVTAAGIISGTDSTSAW